MSRVRNNQRNVSTKLAKLSPLQKIEPETREIVFLCLVGSTPAVLTESIWAMAMRQEPLIPHRIIAVTTSTGRAQLVRQLFTEGHWKELVDQLRKKLPAARERLHFSGIPECLRCITDLQRTRELDDVRTREDNLAVAEYLMELVRGITENSDVRLVVSLAGGRKTTGALLHSVVTLLGRRDDLLTHVLVSEPWMAVPGFLFPGCRGRFRDPTTGKRLDSRQARIELAEVPFVPLRYLFARELKRTAGGFARLMTEVRGRAVAGLSALHVRIDPANGSLRVNGRDVVLGANPFLLYLTFCLRVLAHRGPAISYKEIGEELPALRAEQLCANPGAHWVRAALQNRFEPGEDIRKWAGDIRAALRSAQFDSAEIAGLAPIRGRLSLAISPAQILVVSARAESDTSRRRGTSEKFPLSRADAR